MADEVTRAWQEVGERFSELGRALRERLHTEDDGTDEVKSALQKLSDAAREMIDRADETVRDPAIKESAKSVGRTLAAALGQTFETAGSEIDDLLKRKKGGDDEEAPPSPPPPT
jgi:hypothetical protein